MLKSLGRENRLWKLTESSAGAIAAQLTEDDRPLVVLPMRDVWVAGSRLKGKRPTVCLSEQKLIVTYHPGLFSSMKCQDWKCSDMVSISDYLDRTFNVSFSDGLILKMRGLIGEKSVEAMTESFYKTTKSLIKT